MDTALSIKKCMFTCLGKGRDAGQEQAVREESVGGLWEVGGGRGGMGWGVQKQQL